MPKTMPDLKLIVVAAICWHKWKQKNNRIFNDISSSIENTYSLSSMTLYFGQNYYQMRSTSNL